jgi:hypothetical protein
MIAFAKSSYDTHVNEVTEASAKILMLDRVLAHYGPEAAEARNLLRRAVGNMRQRLWAPSTAVATRPTSTEGELLYDVVNQLAPESEPQRAQRVQALQLVGEVARTRMLLHAQQGRTISMPFLTVVVAWITLMFVSFGLFAPRNFTVITTLVLCALSVSAAVFLILELDQPFGGLIEVSDVPLRRALALLGQ